MNIHKKSVAHLLTINNPLCSRGLNTLDRIMCWLRVRIRVRIRAAAREYTSFLFSFFSCLISVVNTVFGGSVSARLIIYEY